MDFILPYETYRIRYRLKGEALYHALKDAVTEGRLPAGAPLPSSRELAALYGLSRGTVNAVYETLGAEGYVLSEVGRGTRVVYGAGHTRSPEDAAEGRHRFRLSDWGARVDRLPLRTFSAGGPRSAHPGGDIRFEIGIPDLEPFPFEAWNRMLYAGVRELAPGYGREWFQSAGYRGLREAVAAHLSRTRGLAAAPEHLVIVNGSMQAIALFCQLLVNPSDAVAAEHPGYSGVRRAIAVQGGRFMPVPPGPGLVPAVRASGARLVFVTPGRQFPTGAVMPLADRLALLEWASEAGALLVEDDYDSEFRHRGRPLEPLKALDRTGSVAYIGTFTKTLPPGHRIGYALLPEALVEPFVKAKQLYEPHPTALLEQRALARFMQSGHYERHLRRMKRTYGPRFQRLKAGLEQVLADCWEPVPTDCGLYLFAYWKGPPELWRRFGDACRADGVFWSETDGYFEGEGRPSACFGFSHLTEEDIDEGVRRMEQAWRFIRSARQNGQEGGDPC
ncbi:PLP-dependent aminotransferase family protein [Gorillibacterium sp. sgz5001074]|uniref:MocR-like pyridoxine biosynthesis transcription factor PdxR n=1 Tax=Gorillibacterium sp. sgz5001074 TaxID=3446695 RepID=UPI003F67F616